MLHYSVNHNELMVINSTFLPLILVIDTGMGAPKIAKLSEKSGCILWFMVDIIAAEIPCMLFQIQLQYYPLVI